MSVHEFYQFLNYFILSQKIPYWAYSPDTLNIGAKLSSSAYCFLHLLYFEVLNFYDGSQIV